MKNRGFTLVESLAAITVLGILMSIAIPAISKMMKDTKERKTVEDARRFISLAKSTYEKNLEVPDTTKLCLKDIKGKDFSSTAYDGFKYNDNSYVSITSGSNFTVYLELNKGSEKKCVSGTISGLEDPSNKLKKGTNCNSLNSFNPDTDCFKFNS